MSDNRPSAYVDAGKSVYRMSSTGECVRSLYSQRIGIVGAMPPEWLEERYDEGTRLEPIILARVQQGLMSGIDGRVRFKMLDPTDLKSYAGLKHVEHKHLDFTGQFTCEIPVLNGVVIRGHLDAIAQVYVCDSSWVDATGIALGGRVVVEVKKFRKSLWDKFKSQGLAGFPGYMNQMSLAMHATGLPGLFVVGQYVGEKDGEESSEGGAHEIGSVAWEFCREPPVSVNKIKARIVQIERRAEKREPFDVCDVKTWPCPMWRELHDDDDGDDGDDGAGVVRVGEELREEFEMAVSRMGEAQANKKRGVELEKEWRPKLMDVITRINGEAVSPGKDGKKVLRSKGYEVSVSITHMDESTRVVKAHDRTTIAIKPKTSLDD
jgi:hypothetical protein